MVASLKFEHMYLAIMKIYEPSLHSIHFSRFSREACRNMKESFAKACATSFPPNGRCRPIISPFIASLIGREKERAEIDVAQLVRLPNGDQEVMGSTPTFHNGI